MTETRNGDFVEKDRSIHMAEMRKEKHVTFLSTFRAKLIILAPLTVEQTDISGAVQTEDTKTRIDMAFALPSKSVFHPFYNHN